MIKAESLRKIENFAKMFKVAPPAMVKDLQTSQTIMKP